MDIKTTIARVLVATAAVIYSVQAGLVSTPCSSMPPEDPLTLDPLHDSFFMNPDYDRGDIPSSVLAYENITRTPLDDHPENRVCGQLQGAVSSEQINLRSTCPWHYVLNNDNNRIPATLVEAKCNCQGSTSCVGANNPHYHTRCMPVIYYTRVRRKFAHCVNENGQLESMFKSVREPIVVGCTCEIQLRRHRHGHHRNRF